MVLSKGLKMDDLIDGVVAGMLDIDGLHVTKVVGDKVPLPSELLAVHAQVSIYCVRTSTSCLACCEYIQLSKYSLDASRSISGCAVPHAVRRIIVTLTSSPVSGHS